MVERLNFYDLYGYVFPGFVLIALLWLPFGWSGRGWPAADWTSAAAALALSYLAGIFVQFVGTAALPSKFKSAEEPASRPSDRVLDDDDRTLSADLKAKLQAEVKKAFDLDIHDTKSRNDAFFACRAALIANKSGAYSEQFQGIYAMSRGLFISLVLAISFFAGWAASTWHERLVSWQGYWSVLDAVLVAVAFWLLRGRWASLKRAEVSLQIAVTVVLGLVSVYVPALDDAPSAFFGRSAIWLALPMLVPLFAVLLRLARLSREGGHPTSSDLAALGLSTFWLLAFVGFDCAGSDVAPETCRALLVSALLCAVLLVPIWASYRRFAVAFATTVYRDFYVMQRTPKVNVTGKTDG